MGDLEAIESDVPNLMKDVPNFMKDVPNFVKDIPNFVKDVPSVPKCIPRWESTPNLFLMGLKMKIMYHPCLDRGLESNRIGCTKFNEGCTKFCKGCTKRSKVHSEVGIDPQSLPYGFQNEIMYHSCSDRGPENKRIRCTKFCEGCTKGSKVHSEVGIALQ